MVYMVYPRPQPHWYAAGKGLLQWQPTSYGNLQPVYIRGMTRMLGCVLTHLRTTDLESCWGVGVSVLWLIFQHATQKAVDRSDK